MKKTAAIDFSADRLISIAADSVEKHEYIKALKMLNKNAVLNGNDEDSYLLYAEIFDDLSLSEKSINGWFKYLDYAGDGADFAEAYEGLAVGFMALGQDSNAAYYYNKLLMETDSELTPENRQEIINAFLVKEKPTLRFAWPAKLADYSEELNKGFDLMRASDFEGAIEEFNKVGEGNEKYFTARNYIAMCNIIADRDDEAEQECLHILSRDPENVHALTTLSAVKTQQHKWGEAKELAYRLLKLNVTDSDDMYKIATVCCENKLHAEAYDLFCRMDDRFACDCSFLFFKAIAAYNSDKIEKSIQIFDTLLTIYPNAVTADYWYYVVLEESKKPFEKRMELEYFYRLPRSECEANITMLTAFTRLTDINAQKFIKEADISPAIHWCMDEGEPNGAEELKLVGAFAALKGGMDDTVRDVLLDCFIPDHVKIELLSGRVQQNREGVYGIVVCNLYKRVNILRVELGRKKRKTFLQAYGLAFSRFAILDETYGVMIAVATEELYDCLTEVERIDDCKSIPDLAAAIIKFSTVKEDISLNQICDFFRADIKKVEKLLGDLI
ncbi:MAG: tetratricopeptide repeat protein [Candidatus Coproplasma sp.]